MTSCLVEQAVVDPGRVWGETDRAKLDADGDREVAGVDLAALSHAGS